MTDAPAATPRTIHVTLMSYEGDDFPDADRLFEAYVLELLGKTYPGARIEVSTAQGDTRVFLDGEEDRDLAAEIGADWWTAFCETLPGEDACAGHPLTIEVETRVGSPRPTATDVTGGVDCDAEVWLVDEAGERHGFRGEVTYAPDLGRSGDLAPYGGAVDHWMSDELVRALRTPWVAAHPRLVEAIVESLAGGPGVEQIAVEI